MDLFQTEFSSFQGLNIARKSSVLCVGGVPKQTGAMVFPPPPKKFLFGRSRNARCLKNRTIVEADPGPQPTAKMKLF